MCVLGMVVAVMRNVVAVAGGEKEERSMKENGWTWWTCGT